MSRSLIRIRRHFNRQKIILLRFQSSHSPHSNCLFVARVSHSVMDLWLSLVGRTADGAAGECVRQEKDLNPRFPGQKLTEQTEHSVEKRRKKDPSSSSGWIFRNEIVSTVAYSYSSSASSLPTSCGCHTQKKPVTG